MSSLNTSPFYMEPTDPKQAEVSRRCPTGPNLAGKSSKPVTSSLAAGVEVGDEEITGPGGHWRLLSLSNEHREPDGDRYGAEDGVELPSGQEGHVLQAPKGPPLPSSSSVTS